MRNIFLGAAVFIGATAACVGHITARTEMRATEEVCRLIRDNYFRAGDADVRDFLRRCETDSLPFTYTRAKTVKHLNARLTQIKSSHLSVYSPDENRRIWDNEGSETGLRSRMIDGELVVTAVLDDSPAAHAQLRAGDVVVSINGEPPSSPDDAESMAGFFKIARGNQIFQTDLKLEEVREDLSPRVSILGANTALLRIPSFLPQYFEEKTWGELAAKITAAQNVIVDLRANAGGSFPAMLRALSVFQCGVRSAGFIWRSKKDGDEPPIALGNDLDAERQLELLRRTDRIELKTFGSPCFKGRVIVLVDNLTSSVSEIFAHAMMSRAHTQVWGWPTAGQVVMARWFQIGSLGGDYAMSIPIAGYRAENGDQIESEGIHPTRELHYDLTAALRGEDSWVTNAQENLARVSF